MALQGALLDDSESRKRRQSSSRRFAVRDRLPRDGDLFRLYLLLFGVTRFGLEFLRDRQLSLWGLSAMQLTCLELTVVGAVGLALSYKRRSSALGTQAAT